MPTEIEKIENYADHLLDEFIGLREKYSILEPMLFDANVIKTRGSREHTLGFLVLRNVLFLSCIQDVVNIAFDKHEKTPSICKLLDKLNNPRIIEQLEERYALRRYPDLEKTIDPETFDALKRLEKREYDERREEFRVHLREIRDLWSKTSNTSTMKNFCKVRNKVSAHKELQFDAGKYQLLDIGTLAIKWHDLGTSIESMQRLIELVGMIFRSAGFDWDLLHRQLSKVSKGFWEMPAKSC